MPITLIKTAGAANANTFADLVDSDAYFDTRSPLDPAWVSSGSERYMTGATRVLDTMSVARKVLYRDKRYGGAGRPYYVTTRAWTGAPASDTQALAWPRTGMKDRLGRDIADDVIPAELVEATCELAGQLKLGDRTLDSDVKVQGITSVKAGSVAVTFKDAIDAQVIPDAVLNLLPPSWFTDELVSPARSAEVESLG